jgi:16S rRNA (cytidine1402-2'-O)-methyltransferase
LSRDILCRDREIVNMEKMSRQGKATQMCIEAPHRNMHAFKSFIEQLSGDTLFCVACDLTLPTQIVMVHKISYWKTIDILPNITKKPTIFLLYCADKKNGDRR